MAGRPTCTRCSKSIANDPKSCGDNGCLNVFHPRCAPLYVRTAAAASCCKLAFPFGTGGSRQQNRRTQARAQSRTVRAQNFDRDRDVNFDLNLPSASFNSILPFSQPSSAAFHQSQPHLTQQSNFLSYLPNSAQTLDPMRSREPVISMHTPQSANRSVPISQLPINSLRDSSQIVHPDTFQNLTAEQQASAMYSCMYSCLLSNQNMQSQLSEFNSRIAASENNSSLALSVATANQDEVAQLREELTDLRAAAANSNQSKSSF